MAEHKVVVETQPYRDLKSGLGCLVSLLLVLGVVGALGESLRSCTTNPAFAELLYWQPNDTEHGLDVVAHVKVNSPVQMATELYDAEGNRAFTYQWNTRRYQPVPRQDGYITNEYDIPVGRLSPREVIRSPGTYVLFRVIATDSSGTKVTWDYSMQLSRSYYADVVQKEVELKQKEAEFRRCRAEEDRRYEAQCRDAGELTRFVFCREHPSDTNTWCSKP